VLANHYCSDPNDEQTLPIELFGEMKIREEIKSVLISKGMTAAMDSAADAYFDRYLGFILSLISCNVCQCL
jgi:hypothetical protein